MKNNINILIDEIKQLPKNILSSIISNIIKEKIEKSNVNLVKARTLIELHENKINDLKKQLDEIEQKNKLLTPKQLHKIALIKKQIINLNNLNDTKLIRHQIIEIDNKIKKILDDERREEWKTL